MQVERQFSPEIRQPFEKHAYMQGASNIHHDETIIQAQQWIKDNLRQNLSIASLAAQFDISQRSFSRRFKAVTQLSPLAYWQLMRINAAKELLRESNLSVAETAYSVGYQDVSHFCTLFKRLEGQTPMEYRNAVRGKLFSMV